MNNSLTLLPGSQPIGEGRDALLSASYEKGQSTIETPFGWLDIHKATRERHPTAHYGFWRLTGWYTAK